MDGNAPKRLQNGGLLPEPSHFMVCPMDPYSAILGLRIKEKLFCANAEVNFKGYDEAMENISIVNPCSV